MKNKIGVVTSTYPNYNAEEALRGISKAGFKYVELASAPSYFEHILPRPEERVDKESVDGVLNLVNKYGLTMYCVAGHTRLMKENCVDNFKKVLDFAGLAGVKFVTTDTGEVKTKEDEKKFYSIIKELGDYAEDKGITVCLEMHGGWCNTGKIGAQIIKKAGHPNVKLNYDTANVVYFGGVRPEEDLKYALPVMGFVHLKDHGTGKLQEWNFPALGEGIIDFKKVFTLIKNYAGPISVEIEFDGKKRSLEEINKAVKKSYDFLKGFGYVQ
jgi:sugar phosphate isomerase/epimerase